MSGGNRASGRKMHGDERRRQERHRPERRLEAHLAVAGHERVELMARVQALAAGQVDRRVARDEAPGEVGGHELEQQRGRHEHERDGRAAGADPGATSGSRRDRTPWFGGPAPYGRPRSARADRYYRGVASTRHSCHRMGTGRNVRSVARSRGLRDRLLSRSVRTARRRRHPRPQRGREDRPRARQVARATAASRRSSSTTARPTAPATRPGPTAPRSSIRHEVRGGVGAAIRDGWLRRPRARPAVPRPRSPATTSTYPPSWSARSTRSLAPQGRLRPGLALDGAAARSWARPAAAASGRGSTRPSFSVLALRRVTDATNGFRVFRSAILRRPQDRHPPGLARQLRPRAVRAVQGHPARLQGDRVPVHRRLPRQGGLHEDARPARLVAALPAGRPAPVRGQAMMTPGALLRRAPDPRHRRGRLRRRRRRQAARRRRREGDRPRRPVHRPGRDDPVGGPVRPGLGHRREARQRARRGELARLPPRRPEHHREHEEPARRLRDEHRRHAERAHGGPRGARRAGRLQLVDLGLRQPAEHPDQRGRRRRAAEPVRGEQARRRALLPRLLRELRPADLGRPLLEHLRPGPAPGQPVLRRRRASSSPSAFDGEPLQIHGDGLQTRDFTYIDDAVEATLLAAIHPRAEGEVFNVGTGIETSIADLARMVGLARRPGGRRQVHSTAATSTTSGAAS